MHALGHAAVALLAGVLVRALVGGGLPSVYRSSGRHFVSPDGIDEFSLAVLALGAMTVKVSGQAWAAYLQAKVSGELGAWVRQCVLDAWLGVHRLRAPGHRDHGDHDGVDGSAWAEPVAALTERVADLEVGMSTGILGGARALAQLVPLAVLLVVLAPRLAGAAVLVFVPFAVGLGALRRRWKAAVAARAKGGEALLEAADQAVRHADLWATFGARDRLRRHLAALGQALAIHGARTDVAGALISGSNEVLGALALAAALLAARAGWLGDGVSSALLPFAITFFLAYRPLRELTDARLALSRARIAVEAFEKLGAADDSVESAERGWDLGALEVKGLRCRRGEAGALTFSAAPGAIVAIVGPTGVGKTTLVRTLLGLERAEAGTVCYDGVALDDAPPGPGTRPFAWVPQDSPLLLDTLEANVRLSSDAAAVEPVLEALGASRLLTRLGTARLGPGGRSVSGGERQWIAMARAIATQAPVLLLDEPTSGLDTQAQAEVLAAIARLRGRRTVLLVTHRPEPLAIADQVIRLVPRREVRVPKARNETRHGASQRKAQG
jgi:ABC-type multidrug transport system fused ATPase/permease subunit